MPPTLGGVPSGSTWNLGWGAVSVSLYKIRPESLCQAYSWAFLTKNNISNNKNPQKIVEGTQTSFPLLEKNISKARPMAKVLAHVARGTPPHTHLLLAPVLSPWLPGAGQAPGPRGFSSVHRTSIKVLQTASLKKDVY